MSRADILVVDTQPALIESVIGSLSDQGYTATGISSSQDALTIISNKTTDLLVTELDMPDISGLELIKRALLIDPQIGTVVMIRDTSPDVVIKVLKAGVQSILAKPFSNDELAKSCGEALEKCEFLKQGIRMRTLMPLFDVSRSLVSELRTDKLFHDVVRTVPVERKADFVALMLINEPCGELVLKAGTGLSGDLIGKTVDRTVDWLPYSVIETGEAIIVKDRVFGHTARNYPFASVLCVPVMNRGKVIGVLKAGKSRSGIPFSECDLELLSIIAGQAAIAIENAKLFDKVRVEKARLSGLMRKHLKAQEDERWRVSEELHDSVVQWLVSALYHCQSSSTLMGMSRVEEANTEIDRVREVIEQCVQETRRIMLDFRPKLLGELGLVEALKHNVADFKDETGIECEIVVTGDTRKVIWTHSITIYRVIMEALSNIRKHAQASMANIKIEFDQEHICVEISDDGSGFNLSEAVQHGRLAANMGLQTMQERAEIIGGKLLLEATPGTGTKIILIIPLNKNRNNHKNKQLSPVVATVGETIHE